MKSNGKNIYLSTPFIEAALSQCNLPGNRFNIARHFINLLIQKQAIAKESNEEFWCQLPKSYLVKIYTNSYPRWLKELKKSEIIQIKTSDSGKQSYSTTLHNSKEYRINPNLRPNGTGGNLISISPSQNNGSDKPNIWITRPESIILTPYTLPKKGFQSISSRMNKSTL